MLQILYQTGDLLRDGKVKPRDIQQRFQQKLNQERQQITKGGRALQEAQYSSVPDIDTSNPTATCNNISQKSKEDPLRSFDSDSMFGEEIPLDDIEDMLGFGQKENHEPQPLATTATHSPSASPVAFKPTAEISASASTIAPNADLDDDDDMFGDDIPLDLLDEPLPSNAEPSNTKHAQDTTSQEQLKPPNMRYNRYMVADVKKDKYLNGDQGVLAEKVVTLLDETNDFPKRARLREDWIQTHVEVGYIVHIPISADKQTCNDVIIDNAHGYLIVHPDRLISSTAIAESFFCLRKSVLQQKVKSLGDYSEALVHGNLIHRIVQNALQSNDFSLEGLMKETQRVVGSSLEELLAIGQNETTTMNILMEKAIQYIKAFGEIYVGPQPNAKATIATDIGPDVSTRLGCKNVAISRILDVEEHLWSPTYGLKGMVDVSIELAMRPSEKTLIVPLELKTGKTNRFISHRAQTMLYTLLMGDRYGMHNIQI
ncbi:DNA replication factor Dna2-domain-containing protein [Zychaea mexicana]|uniref:DNA replication factor Dna2-domain-containing protein n=1 Tax=Zychaea mexicana TaxID=64656 RepID=UPI0022FE2C62|nr:DNA replication factor Dna2-domain-containing protein [Zychaea mexicana]KAI9482550.1 DNA replication factor Dna2-domain-containing protein [Zychaea mexicana]